MLDPVASQDRTQPAHQDRQLILGPGGRGGVPQRVDQHAGRHGLPAGQREQLQREPRLAAAERLRLDPVHAEIAEHPHGQRLHARIKSWPPARGQGDVTALPQGHDAWVVGDEPVVVVDWFGASNYART